MYYILFLAIMMFPDFLTLIGLSNNTLSLLIEGSSFNVGWDYLILIFLLLVIGLGIRRYEIKLHSNKNKAKNIKKLSDARAILYSNISHEFRTPLTVINGIVNEIAGYETQKILILRNTDILLKLINQILKLSKLDSGLMKLDLIQGNIIEFTNYVVESFQYLAKSGKIQLVFYSEPKEFFMDFDLDKFQHIVSNIISNAIHFTEEGGQVLVHLFVECEKEKEVFVFKVKDNGIGIHETEIPFVFDRYYQVNQKAQPNNIGSGIGLSLTKELVMIMGGEINLKSALGKGSEFEIRIPVERKMETKIMDMPSGIPDQSGFENDEQKLLDIKLGLGLNSLRFPGRNTEKNPVLLIVEDNADVILYLRSILDKIYNIQIAENGESGVEKAIEIIPDIIISDVMMPYKNGLELCQTLKNNILTSHIPIILLTARVENEDRIEGLRKGADAYLTKPFQKDELLIRLENLVTIRSKLQLKYQDSNSTFTKTPASTESAFLDMINIEIDKNLDNSNYSIVQFSRDVGLSRSQLFRKIKAITGYSVSLYLRNYRLKKARHFIETSELNISEIAFKAGFNDLSYFSSKFKEQFGVSPSSIREKA